MVRRFRPWTPAESLEERKREEYPGDRSNHCHAERGQDLSLQSREATEVPLSDDDWRGRGQIAYLDIFPD
jgi:hypothetical protein